MVSLGNEGRNPSGGYSFQSDVAPIFDELDEASLSSSVLIADEETKFRSLRISGIIIFELLITASLAALPLAAPYLLPSEDVCFALSCGAAAAWAALFLCGSLRAARLSAMQRRGYLELPRRAALLQRLPLVVASLGNVLLVVMLALFQKYCPKFKKCPPTGSLYCYHYLQILFLVEALILFPCFVKYLILVVKFNRGKKAPDIHQDEVFSSYTHAYTPTDEIGYRDEHYLEEIVEKQADMIRYLKQHSCNLSRKIMKLGAQIEAFQNSVKL